MCKHPPRGLEPALEPAFGYSLGHTLGPALGRRQDPGAVGYLRMGLGKPLGLGTLEVSIAKNGLRAVRGADLAESYANLDGCLGLATPVVGVEDFPLPNEKILLTFF